MSSTPLARYFAARGRPLAQPDVRRAGATLAERAHLPATRPRPTQQPNTNRKAT